MEAEDDNKANRFVSNQEDISSIVQLVYGSVDHVGIIVKDVNQSVNFFVKVLGFLDETERFRPKSLNFPGAFLRVGYNQIHLMQIPNPDELSVRPAYPGRDRHIAISVNHIHLLQDRLESNGIAYHLSSSGRKALFCRDLDGNAFEFVEIPTVNDDPFLK